MKSTASFLLGAAALIGFLVFLSSRNTVPAVPADALHRNAITNALCLECHGPDKRAPLKSTHPPKEQCLTCHKPQARAPQR